MNDSTDSSLYQTPIDQLQNFIDTNPTSLTINQLKSSISKLGFPIPQKRMKKSDWVRLYLKIQSQVQHQLPLIIKHQESAHQTLSKLEKQDSFISIHSKQPKNSLQYASSPSLNPFGSYTSQAKVSLKQSHLPFTNQPQFDASYSSDHPLYFNMSKSFSSNNSSNLSSINTLEALEEDFLSEPVIGENNFYSKPVKSSSQWSTLTQIHSPPPNRNHHLPLIDEKSQNHPSVLKLNKRNAVSFSVSNSSDSPRDFTQENLSKLPKKIFRGRQKTPNSSIENNFIKQTTKKRGRTPLSRDVSPGPGHLAFTPPNISSIPNNLNSESIDLSNSNDLAHSNSSLFHNNNEPVSPVKPTKTRTVFRSASIASIKANLVQYTPEDANKPLEEESAWSQNSSSKQLKLPSSLSMKFSTPPISPSTLPKKHPNTQFHHLYLIKIISILSVLLVLYFYFVPSNQMIYCDTRDPHSNCIPCPDHGVCSLGKMYGCEQGYKKNDGLFWPTKETKCVQDTLLPTTIDKLHSLIFIELAKQQGMKKCSNIYLAPLFIPSGPYQTQIDKPFLQEEIANRWYYVIDGDSILDQLVESKTFVSLSKRDLVTMLTDGVWSLLINDPSTEIIETSVLSTIARYSTTCSILRFLTTWTMIYILIGLSIMTWFYLSIERLVQQQVVHLYTNALLDRVYGILRAQRVSANVSGDEDPGIPVGQLKVHLISSHSKTLSKATSLLDPHYSWVSYFFASRIYKKLEKSECTTVFFDKCWKQVEERISFGDFVFEFQAMFFGRQSTLWQWISNVPQTGSSENYF